MLQELHPKVDGDCTNSHTVTHCVFDFALAVCAQEEQRLRSLIESEDLPGEDRFAALVELARWSRGLMQALADPA
jgi:hypothetical protein